MKRLLLILLILAGLFLAGCCCPTCPSVSQDCFLVINAGYNVWGGVYIYEQYNGEWTYTGKWIDFQGIEGDESATISVPCGKTIEVKIIDACGFESHKEIIYISPGYNYLDFSYWKNINKSNDMHCRCSL